MHLSVTNKKRYHDSHDSEVIANASVNWYDVSVFSFKGFIYDLQTMQQPECDCDRGCRAAPARLPAYTLLYLPAPHPRDRLDCAIYADSRKAFAHRHIRGLPDLRPSPPGVKEYIDFVRKPTSFKLRGFYNSDHKSHQSL